MTATTYMFAVPVVPWRHLHLYPQDHAGPFDEATQAHGEGWSVERCTCGFLSWRSWVPEPEWEGSDW